MTGPRTPTARHPRCAACLRWIDRLSLTYLLDAPYHSQCAIRSPLYRWVHGPMAAWPKNWRAQVKAELRRAEA